MASQSQWRPGSQLGQLQLPAAPAISTVTDNDLVPTPPHRRTWTASAYASLWVSILINPSGYILGASLLHLGLSWDRAVLAVFTGSCILLVGLCLNGVPGAKYGTAFPVVARASFGVRGSQIVAVLRGLIAIFYMSINMWIGAGGLASGLSLIIPLDHGDGRMSGSSGGGGGGGGGGMCELTCALEDIGPGEEKGYPSGCIGENLSVVQLVFFLAFVLVHCAIFIGDGVRPTFRRNTSFWCGIVS